MFASIAIALLMQAPFAQAQPLPSPSMDEAAAVQSQVTDELVALGANSIGIGACDASGAATTDFSKPWEYCVSVGSPNSSVTSSIQSRFPQGVRVNGVLITIQTTGENSTQPRMSGGNCQVNLG